MELTALDHVKTCWINIIVHNYSRQVHAYVVFKLYICTFQTVVEKSKTFLTPSLLSLDKLLTSTPICYSYRTTVCSATKVKTIIFLMSFLELKLLNGGMLFQITLQLSWMIYIYIFVSSMM